MTRYSSRTGKRGCLKKTTHDATPSQFAQFAMAKDPIGARVSRQPDLEPSGVA